MERVRHWEVVHVTGSGVVRSGPRVLRFGGYCRSGHRAPRKSLNGRGPLSGSKELGIHETEQGYVEVTGGMLVVGNYYGGR